jgi:hypothetical protein
MGIARYRSIRHEGDWVKLPSNKKRQPGGCLFIESAGTRRHTLSNTPPGHVVRKSGGLGFHSVPSVEFLDTASGVDDLLLAGVKRMAGGTDFDVQRFLHRRLRFERIAARAGDFNFVVIGMDVGFHLCIPSGQYGAARYEQTPHRWPIPGSGGLSLFFP